MEGYSMVMNKVMKMQEMGISMMILVVMGNTEKVMKMALKQVVKWRLFQCMISPWLSLEIL